MGKYRCVNCGEKIDPERSYCPHCGVEQPLEARMIAIQKLFGAHSIEIREIQCDECGCKTSFVCDYSDFEDGTCTRCGHSTYFQKNARLILHEKFSPKVECPYCHSTNTRKISTASKVGSLAMWGVLAVGKMSKQWHCNECKSDF